MALLASLTRNERFLLNEVDSVPNKVVRWSLLRQSARHLTSVGFSRIVDRMLRRNLLARDHDALALTFAGMQALKASEGGLCGASGKRALDTGSTPVPSANLSNLAASIPTTPERTL